MLMEANLFMAISSNMCVHVLNMHIVANLPLTMLVCGCFPCKYITPKGLVDTRQPHFGSSLPFIPNLAFLGSIMMCWTLLQAWAVNWAFQFGLLLTESSYSLVAAQLW